MLSRPSRRHHVVVLTCILAIAPIGVALARIAGVAVRLPGKRDAAVAKAGDGNGRAILGPDLSQYGNRKGGFDIPLPAATGPQLALPDEVILPSTFNSLASLDAVGAARQASANGSVDYGYGSTVRRGASRGAASFATGGNGNSGVGAWGGVSGTGGGGRRASASTSSSPRTTAVKTASASSPAPARTSASGSSSGGSSSASSSTPSVSVEPTAVTTPAAPATAATPATAVTVTASAAPSVAPTAAVGGLGATPSAAANPEPLSFLLVGTGLAGLYRARRYFA